MTTFPQTERTRLRRKPDRGSFDRETAYAILDEGLICHVAFTYEGSPAVIPTAYGRDGDRLFIHGSAASRAMRTLSAGAEFCLSVTLVDGLVVARSPVHNSMNFRSVIIYGEAAVVAETEAKAAAMACLTDHLVPGRWAASRPPTEKELKAITVLEVPLDEASAKVRAGNVVDEPEDYDLPVWAGVIPLSTVAGMPVDDGRLLPGVEMPENIHGWRR